MALSSFNDRLYIYGQLVEIPVGQNTVTVDKEFAFDTQIVGVRLFLSDTKLGDYGEISLVHPVAGELTKFGELCYLPAVPATNNPFEIEVFINRDGSEVPAGIKYRMKLNATDIFGRKIVMWLMLRR